MQVPCCAADAENVANESTGQFNGHQETCRRRIIEISDFFVQIPCCGAAAHAEDVANELSAVQYHGHHKCLRFIKISGFCGSRNNVKIAKFLVQVSQVLQHVIVERKFDKKTNSYYRCHGSEWHGEQEPEAVRDMLLGLMKSTSGVQLTFLCSKNSTI